MSILADVCKDPRWLAAQTLRSQELYALIRMAGRKGTPVTVVSVGRTYYVDQQHCQFVPSGHPLRGTCVELKRRCSE